MQGLFLEEMEKFVHRELGDPGLARMRSLVGRGNKGYQFDKSYPDNELGLIVRGLAEATGAPPTQLLEMFGEGMVPGLLEVYGFLVNPRWSFIDLLLNTEGLIHAGVRLNTPGSKPPVISAQLIEAGTVVMTYKSQRRLCAVARGILRGCATHYKVEIMIADNKCMLRGDPECVITVRGEEI